ncbi:histidine phosphatase family protein [Microbulbifer sp. SA54]|uniref:histidine phosphatase family protein n=1 Tax=Microbulbifer sp. SA54 TaxID=3401577 RepID=UPI003AACEB33
MEGNAHRIILIRHGEADKSPEDADPGLTATGHQQAQSLSKQLSQLFPEPERVGLVSSPKTRALQTAIPTASAWQKKIVEEPAVIEIPSPQGLPLAERGKWIQALLHSSWSTITPAQQVWRERTIAFLRQLGSTCTGADTMATTLVFCHFMVINSVVAAIRGDDRVAQFHPDYTSCTELSLVSGDLWLVELGREKNSGNRIR